MRRMIERLHGKMGDHEVPSIFYLSDKLELELNNPQATPLDEVLSLDDVDEPRQRLTRQEGSVVRSKQKIRMPACPEALSLDTGGSTALCEGIMASQLNCRP